MKKQAALDPLVVATPLAAVTSDLVTGKAMDFLREKGMEHLKTLPTSRRDIRGEVQEKYDIDPGYAYVPRLSRGNAMFINRGDIKDYLRRNADLDPKIKKKLVKGTGKHGLVVAGKGWKKPGIVEHEFGHAIAQHKGTPLEKLVHKPWVEDYGRYYHTIPSHLIGGTAGRLRGAGAGVLAGGLAGLLLGMPSIYREMVADKYGEELASEADRKKIKNWPFLGSYIAQAALPAAATGGVVGGASQLLKLLRKVRK